MATVADDALNAQAVNRMLGAGADVAQTFQQTILRHNNEYSALSINAARTFELMSNLLMTNSAMELSGNAMQLQAGVLGFRATGAQPQSGGGPGQPVSFPVQQALPTPPAVYAIGPTGTVTKA